MKRILVVEDDPIISRVYQHLFPRAGYQLELAADGEQAIQMLDVCQPDLIVVDLMLPKVHGIEVIKQVRARPQLAAVPVIVFTNAYLSTMVKAARRAGANECLTKADYSPEQLLQVVGIMLDKGVSAAPEPGPELQPAKPAPAAVEPAASAGAATPEWATAEPPGPPPTGVAAPVGEPAAEAPEWAAPTPSPETPGAGEPPAVPAPPPVAPPPLAPASLPPAPAAVAPAPVAGPPASGAPPAKPAAQPVVIRVPPSALRPPTSLAAAPAPAPVAGGVEGGLGSRLGAQIARQMLGALPPLMTSLRTGMAIKDRQRAGAQLMPALLASYELLHTLTGQAGVVGLSQVARLAGALEALVKEMLEDPENLTTSTLRTVGHALESVMGLLRSWSEIQYRPVPATLVLAVDDEVISRRTLQAALELAELKAVTTDDPKFALRLLADNAFDLIFLDVEMPGMNGFELCSRLREMPRHQTTPVVFVTSISDYESRVRSTMSGGSDFIAKPFLLAELAVKSLTYVLGGPARGAKDQRKPF
jgi:CheY-like chemotaxis protein